MNKGIKYALVFTGGAAVGFGICGVKLISYALNDDDIRDGIKKKVSNRIDKALYGDRVSYAHYYNPYRNYRRSTYCTNDNIRFDSREKAEDVLTNMQDIIDAYGFATVADLYDLSGITSNYTDCKYGWTHLRDANIIRLGYGYTLKLPRTIAID